MLIPDIDIWLNAAVIPLDDVGKAISY